MERGGGHPPPRVFWEKRLQALENKGNECGKERKETTKRRQAAENMGFATEPRLPAGQVRRAQRRRTPPTPSILRKEFGFA
jgi:hypothetical protein